MSTTCPPSCPARDAADFGLSSEASGRDNQIALQRAVAGGGAIAISRPGTYRLAGTVLLDSHTALRCTPGVILQKVDEQGPFAHVLLNRGALTRDWDEDILVEGLRISVNGVDHCTHEVFGLRGQLAFFRVRDLRIRGFRCFDLGKAQYCIHVCSFEDLLIDDVIIHGDKDGVHLGRGKRFRISNGVFRTHDDAIALNAHDYDTGNPELGWIEDGLVERCHDLDGPQPIGFFCRVLAGAWVEWFSGMELQKSDTVISAGRLYRVRAEPDGRTYRSLTPPTHLQGAAEHDGITWMMVQEEPTPTAGVRNVTFRDIHLNKNRVGFSIHFDCDRYSRSYYPGAPVPRQERLAFDAVRVQHAGEAPLLQINTPVDALHLANTWFGAGGIVFRPSKALASPGPSAVNLQGCAFTRAGPMTLLRNDVPDKHITLRSSGSLILHQDFQARCEAGPGRIAVAGDLPIGQQPAS